MCRDLGQLNFFLGLKQEDSIVLSQRRYISQILIKFEMNESTTTMIGSPKLSKKDKEVLKNLHFIGV